MKSVASWLARNTLLYAFLVAAILFAALALPVLRTTFDDHRNGAPLTLEAMRQAVLLHQREAETTLAVDEAKLRSSTHSELQTILAERKGRLVRAQALRDQPAGIFDSLRPTKILERSKLELSINLLQQQITAAEAALAATTAKITLTTVRAALNQNPKVPSERAIVAQRKLCGTAVERLEGFKDKPTIERALRNWLNEEMTLRNIAKNRCNKLTVLRQQRADGLALLNKYRLAADNWQRLRNWNSGAIKDTANNLVRPTIIDVLWKALLALCAIIITPFLIRYVFYFVVAPAVERRGSVDLNLPHSEIKLEATAASSTSVALRLETGQVLLVRQGYLQTGSDAGPKATQWFLDWRRPFSSMASGLVFLTRMSGAGETTTVSAVRDPFAELTVLELPIGSSLVLHPRAIAAVVQRVAHPLLVTSHWRLGSLSAWLTLQLRFLVFHGPARIVVKGGRGVRVERAEQGRIFGQDQLVGFSTDLTYSVSRTETFWPYFFGSESLLKDRVAAGGGILVVEEAPMAGRKGGIKSSLEGAVDAFLKAFGL